MRLSEYFIPTLKETPSDAVIKSHQLMLRAGLVRMLSAGIYSYLPLGWKTLKNVMEIVREEMDAIGGQEVFLPALNPQSIWEETGRASDFGDEMFHFSDRKGSDMCLAPTHEEIICSIARNDIRSYKELPQIWYQIQNKFRDEPRPRSGLLRTRQFLMKDSYTLDYNEDGLDVGYNKHARAYRKIFERCGLKYFEVGASSGLMGGSASQEFMVESEIGEDTVALCDSCGYAANAEIASFKVEPIEDSPYKTLEEISTPETRTINEVSKFLNIESKYFMKSLIYVIDSQISFILIRGDYDLNESKMLKTFGANFRPATPEEVLETCKANTGFISPVGVKGIPIYVDNSIKDQKGFVSGANKDHFHLGGIDPKDFQITKFVDVASVKSGDFCANCDQPLRVTNAIELGHIFKLGTKYSKSMGATILDQNGKEVPIIMGSYGIGIERIMAAFIEQNSDENGIIWDFPISPFDIHLLPINYKNDLIKETSDSLYQDLRNEGLECLIDDRDFGPGYKFRDADLIGIPLQVIIGDKNVKNNKVELKYRKSGKKELVEIKDIVSYIKNIISSN
jgi:prolyl-tRNA synthetase